MFLPPPRIAPLRMYDTCILSRSVRRHLHVTYTRVFINVCIQLITASSVFLIYYCFDWTVSTSGPRWDITTRLVLPFWQHDSHYTYREVNEYIKKNQHDYNIILFRSHIAAAAAALRTAIPFVVLRETRTYIRCARG